MTIRKRFFRVEGGLLLDEIEKIRAQRDAATAASRTLLPAIGATEAKFWPDGTFACFVFAQTPDPEVYRNTGHGWTPKKNCAAGKAIWKQLMKLPRCPDYQNALKHVGLRIDVPGVVDEQKGVGYWPVMGGFPTKKIWFVEVPWRDVDPAEMAQYISDREVGERFNSTFEYLRWTPPAEWIEIKEWQYLKEWEELQEQVA